MQVSFRQLEAIKKGWGEELVIANNEFYCGKLLVYKEREAVSSAHFHLDKTETFYVVEGMFDFRYWDEKGVEQHKLITPGDVIHIPRGAPHQLICHRAGVIFEVSTPHSDKDVVRIAPGDSQRTEEEKLSRLRAEHGVYE